MKSETVGSIIFLGAIVIIALGLGTMGMGKIRMENFQEGAAAKKEHQKKEQEHQKKEHQKKEQEHQKKEQEHQKKK